MKGKRILVLMLALIMIVSTVSCGKKNESDNGRETITIFGGVPSRISDPKTGIEKSDESWYKLIEDKNDVNIKIQSPASSNLEERLQVMISSGEYPDVILFQEHNANVFKSAVEKGIVIPINEYLEDANLLKENIHENSWKCMQPPI